MPQWLFGVSWAHNARKHDKLQEFYFERRIQTPSLYGLLQDHRTRGFAKKDVLKLVSINPRVLRTALYMFCLSLASFESI